MDEASGENLYLNNDNVAVELSLAMQNLFKCINYFFRTEERGKRKEAPFPLRLASLFSQEKQGKGERSV